MTTAQALATATIRAAQEACRGSNGKPNCMASRSVWKNAWQQTTAGFYKRLCDVK